MLFLVHVEETLSEQSSEEDERAEQQLDMRKHCAELLDSAAVHLRRAMVACTPTHPDQWSSRCECY